MSQDTAAQGPSAEGAATQGTAMVPETVAGLDPEQRAAVTAPAGPLCVLAGAGTGKTRAITHRIAHRVVSGEVVGRHVLAVTFTARAAGQLRDRLAQLGAEGVQARTFHAAALRQLRYFAPRLLAGRALPELVESKAQLVTLAAARARLRADRATARDLASEIEWAKSHLVEPGEYATAAAEASREPPVDRATVGEVYTAYEELKRTRGVIDFEDLLRAMVWGVEEHPDVAEQIRAQYRHFVVDEYQDVNPLQQRLLDAWLGGRDDLTVVGDASQTIYSFTGATSSYLLTFPQRYPGATVVRLVRDYRSTPQVVALANGVIRQASGEEARARLALEGQRPHGPEPDVRIFPDEPTEAAAVAARCAELISGGTPAREIAVLFRTHAQSQAYEDALAEAGVPAVVTGAARFFERPEVRQAVTALRAAAKTAGESPPDADGADGTDGAESAGGAAGAGGRRTRLAEQVAEALAAVGWQRHQPPSGGAARERWEALAALVTLAEELSVSSLSQFCDELARRAAIQHSPTMEGVTLASLHAAKGLEWDAVFLVGLVEGVLPISYARTQTGLEEERRLLYVGVTRARERLWLSYGQARTPGGRARRPCRFLPQLGERGGAGAGGDAGAGSAQRQASRRRAQVVACRVCGASLLSGVDRKLGRCADCPSDRDEELYERLREWRRHVAAEQQVPAYVVFTDATLGALAERRPASAEELTAIGGIGARKAQRYGDAVLALVSGADVSEVTKSASDEEFRCDGHTRGVAYE